MPEKLTTGSKLGKYAILRELGRGGMGVVYLAEDTALKRCVAVKVLHSQYAADPAFAARFQQEAQAAAQLFHPNIVPVNALVVEDGLVLIEMPHLEGGSLACFTDGTGGCFPEVVRFSADVLDALSACHRRGLVHRDVKPSNVLLDETGRALLADFGLARAAGERFGAGQPLGDTTSVFLGTPRYAPLEAWDNRAPTPAWDLYSVGVMLYEGLSGRPPYQGNTPLALLRALEGSPLEPLASVRSDVSPMMDVLVSDLLSKDIETRAQDAEEVRLRLLETPEFAHVAGQGSTRTLRVSVAGRRTPTAPWQKIRKGSWRVAPWVGWGLVLLLSVPALLWASRTNAPPQPTVSPASRELQATAFTTLDLTETDLLQQVRFGPPGQGTVYRSVYSGSTGVGEEYWLVRSTADDALKHVLVQGPLRLSTFSMRLAEDGHMTLEGIWGAYADPSSLVCLSGVVRGTGRWLSGADALACELVLEAAAYGVRFEETVLLHREERTDTAFLWALEESPLTLPLLCNDLLPREPLWWKPISEWLPAMHQGGAAVQWIGDGGNVPHIDGVAEALAWEDSGVSRTNAFVTGRPGSAEPELRARATNEGLFLLLTARAVVPTDARIRVAVLRQYRVPAESSPCHFATFQQGDLVASQLVSGTITQDWHATWQGAAAYQDREWNCEVFIPYDNVGLPEGLIRPEAWRVNVVVHEDESPENLPLLVWGAPRVEEVLHGALLWLRPPESEASQRGAS